MANDEESIPRVPRDVMRQVRKTWRAYVLSTRGIYLHTDGDAILGLAMATAAERVARAKRLGRVA